MEPVFGFGLISLWIIVLINLLITMALVKQVSSINKHPEPTILKVGESAPDFSLETLAGETLTLSTFQQKKFLMVFISDHCSHCRPQMPILKEVQPQAKHDGVEIILVGMGEKEAIGEFINEFEINSPVLLTEYGSEFALEYKIPGTPSYYLIDEEGGVASGGFFDHEWEQLIQKWQEK